MTTTFRYPRGANAGQNRGLRVLIDGQEPPYVVEARVTRGFDQDMATCEIVHAHPMPEWVLEGSRVVVSMGDPQSTEPSGGVVPRFTGYVETFSSTLYPGRHTAICKDVLWVASRQHPAQDLSLASLTDVEAVTFLLESVFPSEMLDIGGLDLLLADTDDIVFLITPTESILDGIRAIDEIGAGWRTYALTDGRIVRRPISIIPSSTAAFTFTEGTDLIDGSSDTDSQDPLTEWTVQGLGDSFTFDPSDPNYVEPDFSIRSQPGWQQLLMLTQVASSMTFLSMEDQAAWIYSQLSKKLIRSTITTHRDMLIQGDETVAVESEHLEIDQHLWVQNVQIAVESNGRFTQTLSLLSERQASNRGVTRPFTIVPGQPVGPLTPPVAPTLTPPSAADVLASFAILSIIRELVIRDGVETFIYHVVCQDTSTSRSGTIVSQDWTAAGGGASITTGTGQTFTTTFTNLTAGTITLDVEDTNGNTGSVTRSMANPGVPTMIRKLYAGSSTQAEAFDGTVWRTYTPSNAATMTAVGHGPIWAAAEIVMTTTDDLQTAATESQPFGGSPASVSAVWNEPDVTTGFGAGSAAGGTALSPNGSTWSVKTAPGGSPLRRIIISRFRPGEIHAITDEGYFRSDNYGSGWVEVRAGDFTDLQLSHSRNILVTTAGALINANTGAAFTFPSLSPAVVVIAATAHIREDKFYAIDDQGRTFHQFGEASGSSTMVQGASIPAGAAQPRGIYRDGVAIDKVYCALGAGGLSESVDGFRSSAGWELLRAGTVAWP